MVMRHGLLLAGAGAPRRARERRRRGLLRSISLRTSGLDLVLYALVVPALLGVTLLAA